MKTIFAIRSQPIKVAVLLLLVRIVIGIAFITTSYGKIHDPLHSMGLHSAFPGISQALAAISESCGSIAVIVGIVTWLAAFGISRTMIVAVHMVRFVYSALLVNVAGRVACVLPSVLLSIALLLLIIDPGRFSLHRLVFGVR